MPDKKKERPRNYKWGLGCGRKEDANQFVYLVTLAASLPETLFAAAASAHAPPLRRVQDATREEVRDAILDAVANPVLGEHVGRARKTPVTVLKGVVRAERLPDPTDFVPEILERAKKVPKRL